MKCNRRGSLSIASLVILLFLFVGIIAAVSMIHNPQTLPSHAAILGPTPTPIGQYDLKAAYPNTSLYQSYYLEGHNYVNPNAPTRAVLWFEKQDQWSFKQYNYGPEDVNGRCHYDLLSWWDDGFLRYANTTDQCPGHAPNQITYNPPILFLPHYWQASKPWSYSSQSAATYTVSGMVKCTGVNTYTNRIIGIELIAPNQYGIHWQTQQNTQWLTGTPGNGVSCGVGQKTRWQEDYWFSAALPVQNSKTLATGLKRSKGGNLDVPSDSWDIWFDSWNLLAPVLHK